MKPISQLVVEALWVSFSSFPPKLAIVAFVVTDIVGMIFVEVNGGIDLDVLDRRYDVLVRGYIPPSAAACVRTEWEVKTLKFFFSAHITQ